jgi:hypothetical protein
MYGFMCSVILYGKFSENIVQNKYLSSIWTGSDVIYKQCFCYDASLINCRGNTANLRLLTDLELRPGWSASEDTMVFIDDSASQRGYGTGKVGQIEPVSGGFTSQGITLNYMHFTLSYPYQ